MAALLLGADDYFAKPLQTDSVVARTRRLLDRPGMPVTSASQPERRERSRLTAREREVLALLVEGERTDAIAQRLCITRKTAYTHIERILGKLGAHSQAQAVAFAVRAGIVHERHP